MICIVRALVGVSFRFELLQFWRFLLVLSITLPSLAYSQTPNRYQPNIVYIMADDLGFSDINQKYMPRTLEILKNYGMRIPFYSAQNCAPSRAAFMTGKLPSSLGITGVDPIQSYGGLQTSENLLSEKLQQAGYRTGIFGKWHLGLDHSQNPLFNGFDEFTGFVHGQINYYGPKPDGTKYPDGTLGHDHHGGHDFQSGGAPLYTEGYSTSIFRDAAIEFIGKAQTDPTPFFAYVPFNAPHTPYAAPKHYVEFYQADFNVTANQFAKLYTYADNVMAIPTGIALDDVTRTRLNKLLYFSSVRALDDAVADIFESLQNKGLIQDTFFMFTSDNGAGTWRFNAGKNGPYRAGKGAPYEGGHRVPNLVVWPTSMSTNNKVNVNVWIGDLYETFLAMAGSPTNDSTIESNNLLAKMLSGTSDNTRKNGTNYISPHISKSYKSKDGDNVYSIWTINSGHMKYIRKVRFNLAGDVTRTREELYDLSVDMGETTDVKREREYSSYIIEFRESYFESGGDEHLRSIHTTLISSDVGFEGFTFPLEWGFPSPPALTLTFASESIGESDGIGATTGIVSRNTDTSTDLVVSLVSDNQFDLVVPGTVIIAAGQTNSSPFEISAIDNSNVGVDRTVSISAFAANHATDTETIEVIEDEVQQVFIELDSNLVSESDGDSAAFATISRNSDISDELIVILTSDNPDKATMPMRIRIAAGESNRNLIKLSVVDDEIFTGIETVTMTVSAIGHAESSDSVTILDNDE